MFVSSSTSFTMTSAVTIHCHVFAIVRVSSISKGIFNRTPSSLSRRRLLRVLRPLILCETNDSGRGWAVPSNDSRSGCLSFAVWAIIAQADGIGCLSSAVWAIIAQADGISIVEEVPEGRRGTSKGVGGLVSACMYHTAEMVHRDRLFLIPND